MLIWQLIKYEEQWEQSNGLADNIFLISITEFPMVFPEPFTVSDIDKQLQSSMLNAIAVININGASSILVWKWNEL